jgi:hypothetical protein
MARHCRRERGEKRFGFCAASTIVELVEALSRAHQHCDDVAPEDAARQPLGRNGRQDHIRTQHKEDAGPTAASAIRRHAQLVSHRNAQHRFIHQLLFQGN